MKQIFSIFIAILALCLWTASCTSLDEVNERIDQLENRVTNIEDALAALQRAYADGKIISSVNHIAEGDGGWLITFSDQSAIAVTQLIVEGLGSLMMDCFKNSTAWRSPSSGVIRLSSCSMLITLS